MIRPPPISTRTDSLFPYTVLFRSVVRRGQLASVAGGLLKNRRSSPIHCHTLAEFLYPQVCTHLRIIMWTDGRSGIFVMPSVRSEEHTSELQSLMRISYAVFCLKTNRPLHNTATHT